MEQVVDSVRAFNRFHTRFVGALDAHYLESDLSLVEVRVLYEIATREAPTASDIQADLGLDAGYLSRIIRRFDGRGWISRSRATDGRRRPIALTDGGRAAFAALNERSRREVAGRLAPLAARDRAALVGALDTARRLLEGASSPGYSVRHFRSGDMGYVTARQAIVYANQFGWDQDYEALVGEITARFLRDFKPGREQCWIAESAGAMAGSIFVMDAGENVAQLRLLYVEPAARGLGIGNELVRRCVAFARAAGYARMTLWTNDMLVSARRLYEAHDFELTASEPHHSFGHDLVGQTWERALNG